MAGRLDKIDLKKKLPKSEQDARLDAAQTKLTALRLQLGGMIGDGRLGPPVCIVFEGWDASGKGGTINRLVQKLDRRHVRVSEFAAPSYDEKRHHFLWRFWPKLPGWGGMAIFDRSWYGRVLVERVEDLAPKKDWQRAYEEIVNFERTLADEGTILIKFWMHISAEEQVKRFEKRRDTPLKRWKLSDEDWRNRSKRSQYTAAVEEMLERTDHEGAPWIVVPAESKPFARVFVAERVNELIEKGMRARGFEPLSAEELKAA